MKDKKARILLKHLYDRLEQLEENCRVLFNDYRKRDTNMEGIMYFPDVDFDLQMVFDLEEAKKEIVGKKEVTETE